jgi:hypothetical protein
MPNIRPKILTIEYQGFKVLVSACATLVLGQAVQDIVNPTKINVIEKLYILIRCRKSKFDDQFKWLSKENYCGSKGQRF